MVLSNFLEEQWQSEIVSWVTTTLNSTLTYGRQAYHAIPGAGLAWEYIRRSYQNDPFRVFLESLLVIFTIKYLLQGRYKAKEKREVFTDKEIDSIVREWQPEPLVASLETVEEEEIENIPEIIGPVSVYPMTNKGKMINLASFNFLGLVNDPDIKKSAISALRKYGVGSCGPPGFYGTIDVHLELERGLASYLGCEDAIIYSQGFSTISSVIPAFSKRADIIVYDEAISLACQKGVDISRSRSFSFRHNDMDDLEATLTRIEEAERRSRQPLCRKFILVEGLYANTGNIVPLPKLLELKYRFKYRVIMDETMSFGVLGPKGAGITDHYGLSTSGVDMIIGSMCHSLGSSGGFCAGSMQVVDHQRLSGQAYCFSASMPALLAVAASDGLERLKSDPNALLRPLRRWTQLFRATLLAPTSSDILTVDKGAHAVADVFELHGHPEAPLMHLRLAPAYARPNDLAQEEAILQYVVDEACQGGVLITCAKYVRNQERQQIRPSIRICISAGLRSVADVEKCVKVLRKAMKQAITNFW